MVNFSNIKQEDCKLKAIPKGITLGKFNTIILQSVINEIKEHGCSSMNKEVCGVLIGNLCWDNKPYLLIDARIEGKFADHQSGSVTFTSETWNYIHSELSDKYPDSKIVGWYHTHPGFGIFLSNMDFFIHENFFGIKWQPAYVYDPQAETDGFFFWNGNNLDRGDITIIEDEVPVEKKKSIQPETKKINVALTDEEGKLQKKRVLIFTLVLLVFLLIIIASSLTIFILYRDNKALESKLEKQKKELEEKVELFRQNEIQQEQDSAVKGRINELEQRFDGTRVGVIKMQTQGQLCERKFCEMVQEDRQIREPPQRDSENLPQQSGEFRATIPSASGDMEEHNPQQEKGWNFYLWPGNWF